MNRKNNKSTMAENIAEPLDESLQIQMELNDEEIVFERFFAVNLDLLCIANTEGTFIKLNKSWEDTLGYSLEELEGRKFLEFVHPEDLAATLQTMSMLSEQKQVLNFTNRYRSKNGSYKFIEWRSQPYGKYIYAAARDITAQKNSELQLRESETNFRTFFETIADVIIVGNLQGKIIYANTAASLKLGYSAEALQKMSLVDLNSKEERAESERIFAEMMAGRLQACPLSLTKGDGTFMPVESSVWFGAWNGMDCFFWVFKDLSTQQAALDRFAKMFNNNPALMAISNLKNEFVDVNSAFIEKLGFSRDEIIGKTTEELQLFPDSGKQKQMAEFLKNVGSIKNMEIEVRKKDGQLIDGLFSGDYIDNHMEKAFLTVLMDISELKTTQAEMTKQTALILSLIDSIQDLVFYKDIQGVYLGCNPQFAAYVGIDREKIIGKTDYQIFDQATADLYRFYDQEMLKQKTAHHNEEWIVYPDGKKVLLDTMKNPLLGIGRPDNRPDRRQPGYYPAQSAGRRSKISQFSRPAFGTL